MLATQRAVALRLVGILAGVGVTLALQSAPQQSTATLAFVGGTLIDGNGSRPIDNSVVLVTGDRITAIGRVGQLAVPPSATVINASSMTVMPGLFEMHAHLMLVGHGSYAHWDTVYPPRLAKEIMPAAARQSLMHGITSLRDLGGPLEPLMEVKRGIDSGRLVGATVYTSGPFIQHEAYPGTGAFRWGVSGVADARAKVKRLADAGVSVIKLIDQDQMTMDEVRAVVDEAHARRLPVIAHAHRPDEIRRGLAAGVDGFEHTGMATAPEYPKDIIDSLHARTAQGNRPPLYWTPTIDVLTNFIDRAANPAFVNDSTWYEFLPADIAADVRRSIQRLDTLAYYRFVPNRKPTLVTKFNQLRQSGVRLLIGTDAGVPANFHGFATPEEMITWVRTYKMDPMETIRSATYWPALSLGVLDRVGTIEVGKLADIIVVRGNPLYDMTSMRRVAFVVKNGKRVK
ncbi:MAG TPA: amidohydrolase family protein [Gemmatimonadaceae bacterium]|nr:amidohydrolase family protein [Gemmatimonadaceae bacterium]